MAIILFHLLNVKLEILKLLLFILEKKNLALFQACNLVELFVRHFDHFASVQVYPRTKCASPRVRVRSRVSDMVANICRVCLSPQDSLELHVH